MDKELNHIRLGSLTLYILKYVEKMPEVGMSAFAALIAQEIENSSRLRAGKSLVSSRLNELSENGCLKARWGKSPNPKAKKSVKFFEITKKGQRLIRQLTDEQSRISEVLEKLPG